MVGSPVPVDGASTSSGSVQSRPEQSTVSVNGTSMSVLNPSATSGEKGPGERTIRVGRVVLVAAAVGGAVPATTAVDGAEPGGPDPDPSLPPQDMTTPSRPSPSAV